MVPGTQLLSFRLFIQEDLPGLFGEIFFPAHQLQLLEFFWGKSLIDESPRIDRGALEQNIPFILFNIDHLDRLRPLWTGDNRTPHNLG